MWDLLGRSRFAAAARDEWLVPRSRRESDSAPLLVVDPITERNRLLPVRATSRAPLKAATRYGTSGYSPERPLAVASPVCPRYMEALAVAAKGVPIFT